ncbi:MAG: Ig-like domain-containing protein [Lachnospiraceae bacterium]|nr:Ig-like domain-containing protein [Lachnospiraceae bacterium]
MNEMKLGICVYCPEFGGKASDYSRYNDLKQESNEKQDTVVTAETQLSLSKTEVTLKKGKSVTLKATLSKKLKKKGVTWKSSDTKVAKVSKKGKVTAKGYGTAVITCTSKKDKKVKATCTVTVAKKGSSSSGTTTEPVVTSGDLSKVSIKIGHDNNTTVVFRYVSGFMVGADGYFTLDSKEYSGELTLDFKTSEGVDSQKITVEKNTKYYLSYFYPIDAIPDTVIQNPPQQIMTGTDPITGLPRYTTIPGTETRIPAVASTIATDVTVRGGVTCTSSITVAGTVKKGTLTYEKA